MTGDTHILRRLGKDISLQELYHMRFELNMSVAEIAEKLGCSRPTVYKYLDLKKLNAPKKPDRKQEQRVWDEADQITDLELILGGGEFFVKNSGDGKFYLEAQNAEKLQV